jgi:hypothetical protein
VKGIYIFRVDMAKTKLKWRPGLKVLYIFFSNISRGLLFTRRLDPSQLILSGNIILISYSLSFKFNYTVNPAYKEVLRTGIWNRVLEAFLYKRLYPLLIKFMTA